MVGPDKVLFEIHKGLLCKHSSYFRASLEGGFKEAKEGVVELPEDDPKIFNIFKTWLYSKKIVIDRDGTDTDCPSFSLCQLYVFADARGVPELQNAVINQLADARGFTELVFVEARHLLKYYGFYLYSNLIRSSPLRRWLIDRVCWDEGFAFLVHNELDDEEFWQGPREFLLDLWIVRDTIPRPIVASNAPFNKNSCETYHIHPDGEERCSK